MLTQQWAFFEQASLVPNENIILMVLFLGLVGLIDPVDTTLAQLRCDVLPMAVKTGNHPLVISFSSVSFSIFLFRDYTDSLLQILAEVIENAELVLKITEVI